MYAVIKTGGKQYKVEEGKWIEVELLPQEEGAAVEFNEILLVSNGDSTKVGTPLVEGKVLGTVVKHDRRKKVIVYKMRPKKHYRRKNGHRQYFTRVMINKIEA